MFAFLWILLVTVSLGSVSVLCWTTTSRLGKTTGVLQGPLTSRLAWSNIHREESRSLGQTPTRMRMMTSPLPLPLLRRQQHQCTSRSMLATAVVPESELLVSPHFPRRADPRIADAVHRLVRKYIDYPYKGSEEDFLIINDPEDTLQHDLLGVDMDNVMRNIFQVGKKKPDTRLKPLLVVFTGMGRGKTRLLVEIDRRLRTHHAEDTLSIPITFNHKWTSIERLRKNAKVNYALAIISRILSMHFRIPLDDVYCDLKAQLKGISGSEMGKYGVEIIRETLRAIVGQCQERGRDVRHLVLSVDETLCVEEEFGPGVHEDLRRALLDERVLPDLDVALVMTSLALNPVRRHTPGRVVCSLTTPMVSLRPKEVFDKWIPSYIPHLVLDDSQRLAMLSLIASVSSLPRAIQFLVQSIQKTMEEKGSSFVLNNETFQIVYNKTAEMLRKQFGLESRSLSTRCLHALLFGESLPVEDPEVRGLLTDSVFTNTVTSFEKDAKIVPQTCPMQLFEVLKTCEHKTKTSKVICKTMKMLSSMLYENNNNKRDVLVTILRGLFDARLKVLGELAEQEKINKTVNLLELLRINSIGDIRNLSENAEDLLETKFKIGKSRVKEVFLPQRSSQSSTATWKELRKQARSILAANNEEPKSNLVSEEESGNLVWLLKTSSGSFCLVVDTASDEEASESDDINNREKKDPFSVNTFSFSSLPDDGARARHFLRLCDLVKKEGKETAADPFSLAGAMQSGNYLYVYVSTRNSPSFFVDDHVLHLGAKDSANLLSFLHEQYSLHQSSSEKKET